MNRVAAGVLGIAALLVFILAIPSLWRDPMGLGAVSLALFGALSAILLAGAWGTWRDRWWGWLIAVVGGLAGLLGAYALTVAAGRGGPLDADDWAWVSVFGVGGGLALAASIGRLVAQVRR